MCYFDVNVNRKRLKWLLKSYEKVQKVPKTAFFLLTKFTAVQTCFFKFLSTFKTSLLEKIFSAILIPHELYSRSVIFLYEYSCILVLNITKAGFQHKPRILRRSTTAATAKFNPRVSNFFCLLS